MLFFLFWRSTKILRLRRTKNKVICSWANSKVLKFCTLNYTFRRYQEKSFYQLQMGPIWTSICNQILISVVSISNDLHMSNHKFGGYKFTLMWIPCQAQMLTILLNARTRDSLGIQFLVHFLHFLLSLRVPIFNTLSGTPNILN